MTLRLWYNHLASHSRPAYAPVFASADAGSFYATNEFRR